MRYLVVSTAANCYDDAFKIVTSVSIDNPLAFSVLLYRCDPGIELCTFIEAVPFPGFGDLRNYLVTIGIAFAPPHRRMEAIQDAMDLQPRCCIDSL